MVLHWKDGITRPLCCCRSTSSSSTVYRYSAILFFILTGLLYGDSLKVGFLYNGKISDFGWNFAHDQGRLYLAESFPELVQTEYVEDVDETDLDLVMRVTNQYISDGYDLIVGTSFNHQDGLLQVAKRVENQKVKFLAVSGYKTNVNMACAFAKIYQARYLAGLVAGAMTKTNKICYIGTFEFIPEVIYILNGFMVGVREMNPKAVMHVYYTHSWSDQDLEIRALKTCLRDHPGADILAGHSSNLGVQLYGRDHDLWTVGHNSDMRIFVGEKVLTSSLYKWGPLYKIFTERVINISMWEGNIDPWWGIDQEMVDIAGFSNKIPGIVKNYVQQRKKDISSGLFEVFCGSIVSDGRFGNITTSNGCLTDAQILSMSAYVDGVVDEGLVKIPPPTRVFLEWSETVSIVIVAIVALFLLYGLVILVLTIIQRNHPYIMSISLLFCVLMQTSGILASVSIILFPGDPTPLRCNARAWLIGIGFIVFYSCLFAKTWRIWKIFSRAKKLKRPKPLSDIQLLVIVGIFLGIELIILISFVSASPLQPTMFADPFNSDRVFVKCSSDNSSVFIIILIIYKALLAFFGSVMAFMTRDVDKLLSESKEIYWVIYTIFLINLLILPLLFFLDLTVQVQFVLASVDILWILFFSFSVLFVPRLYRSFHVSPEEAASSTRKTFSSSSAKVSVSGAESANI